MLVGQVQVLAFTAAAALTYGVTIARAERRRAAAATVAAFGAASVLAAALAAVQLLATFELAPLSWRAPGVDPGLDAASMALRHLATLVLPFAFGAPGAQRWWGGADPLAGGSLIEFWMGCLHV